MRLRTGEGIIVDDFDQLIKDGELVKAAMIFAEEGYENGEFGFTRKQLIEALAEQVQELERKNKELEYASKYNRELNEFLQKRKLPPNTLGRHVVDVVMDYVEELEKNLEYGAKVAVKTAEKLHYEQQQNKRYREVINELRDFVKRGEDECNIKQLIMMRTDEALEGESE